MSRVRAPGRVNLIGDHTDYTGGLVFPMAIDRHTTIDHEPDPDGIVSLESDALAGTVTFAINADFDPSLEPAWGRHVAAVASLIEGATAIRGTITTTIPVGAGLSSSAALGVACALALGATEQPNELALLAQRGEHLATAVPTGIMDQLCITSARAGHATMIDCHDLTIDHVPVPDDIEIVVRFIAHRTLEGSGYGERVGECASAERLIGPLRSASLDEVETITDPIIKKRARHVVSENERVKLFVEALRRGQHTVAGRLMTASHLSLANDFEVSTTAMDDAVTAALATPGVFGARMTGGGFGGCIVALCAPGSPLEGWRVRPSGAAGHIGDDTM